jgi:transposase-like protein
LPSTNKEKTVESLFQLGRGIPELFRQALASGGLRWARKISLDGRSNRYVNNVVEQDRRAIKLRCQPMLGFKSSRTAAVTLAGIELAHRIRKCHSGLDRPAQSAAAENAVNIALA